MKFRSKLKKKTIVGYFNGLHLHRSNVFSKVKKSVYLVEGVYPGNIEKYHDETQTKNLFLDEMLDIPEEFQSWSYYQASAGHLINHDPRGNVEYIDCHHPR